MACGPQVVGRVFLMERLCKRGGTALAVAGGTKSSMRLV